MNRTIPSLVAETERVMQPLGYRNFADAARFVISCYTNNFEEQREIRELMTQEYNKKPCNR